MSSLVFGCPNCQQPFQVADSQAGQVVQCPSCAQTIDIPADAFEAQRPAIHAPASPVAQAVGCPSCGGQFGVTPEMDGQQVACPHCQAPTTIQLGGPPAPPTSVADTEPEEEPEEFAPVIKTNRPVSRKRKKSLRNIAKSKGPARIETDLFAPGHQEETPAASPTTPAISTPAPIAQAPTAQPPTQPPAPNPIAPPPTTPSTPSVPSSPAPTTQTSAKPAEPPETASDSPIVPKLRPANPSSSKSKKTVGVEAQPPVGVSAGADEQSAQDQPTIDIDGTKSSDTRRSIAHLLPPVFDVLDPARMGVRRGNDDFKVFLPDGEGGTAQMDNRILRVKHGEKEVSLVSMTDEQRARQRLIQNIIAIVVGIVVIALAFTILM